MSSTAPRIQIRARWKVGRFNNIDTTHLSAVFKLKLPLSSPVVTTFTFEKRRVGRFRRCPTRLGTLDQACCGFGPMFGAGAASGPELYSGLHTGFH